MKTIKYMLSAVAVLAVLASCNRKESFQHEKFVSFGNGSYTVNEDAGIVAVPVHVYNASSEEVTVTVKATDGVSTVSILLSTTRIILSLNSSVLGQVRLPVNRLENFL